jgi:hypothetical protein
MDPKSSHPLDLDQARAKDAAKAVGLSCDKAFADAAKKAIARLRSSGLLVTLTYGAKKEKEHARIVESLAAHLKAGTKPIDLVRHLTTQSSATLRFENTRAEAYLVWLARFADAAKSEP